MDYVPSARPALPENLVDFTDGIGQSLLPLAGDLGPWKTALRQHFFEAPCHPLPDRLPVPQPVLHEGQVAVGKQIEIVRM